MKEKETAELIGVIEKKAPRPQSAAIFPVVGNSMEVQKDFKELLELLNGNAVEFLVVGAATPRKAIREVRG